MWAQIIVIAPQYVRQLIERPRETLEFETPAEACIA